MLLICVGEKNTFLKSCADMSQHGHFSGGVINVSIALLYVRGCILVVPSINVEKVLFLKIGAF